MKKAGSNSGVYSWWPEWRRPLQLLLLVWPGMIPASWGGSVFDSIKLDAIGRWVREFACAGPKCIRRSFIRSMLSVLVPHSLIETQKQSQQEVHAMAGVELSTMVVRFHSSTILAFGGLLRQIS